MSKRTTNSSRLHCALPLCVESLESRQLLSGIPWSSSALPEPLMALSRVIRPQGSDPVMVLHDAPGVSGPVEAVSREVLVGKDGSWATKTDYPVPDGQAAHSAALLLSHGTTPAANPEMSSAKASDSLRKVGSAAQSLHLPSFGGSRRAQARRFKGVAAATPSASAHQADTRTQKGRAIARANLWFEIAAVIHAAAKTSETAATTESQPFGFEQQPAADLVPQSQLALPMSLTGEAGEIVFQVDPGQANALRRDAEIMPPAPSGAIVAGWLPIDLPALERKVDAFFSQIEKLGEEATETLISSRLTPWLVIGTITVGISYVLARRHLKVPALDGVRTGSDSRSREWTWLSNGAVLPPWEKF